MRRYLALIGLLFLSIPAGISVTGCYRNPAGNYCNGLGYGLKDNQVASIDLEPRTTGISLSFGQTRLITPPTAKTCHGEAASAGAYTWGTTNNKLLDISPNGNMCAGTWNRNSGGGIADYTICNFPNPLPTTDGLPYGTVYISASADSVTSNPVEVYVHAQVSSISLALAGTQQCYSQGAVAQLDAQACYASNGTQYEFCAPSTVTNYACKLPPGVQSVPNCSTSIGTLVYSIGTASIASLNSTTNQITAEQPGTTLITAQLAGSGSSAGNFSVCPPKSISVSLNGQTSGIVTQGVQQNLVTTVLDTNGQPISGLLLDYQSTNPLAITAGAGGAITAAFPGAASVYAICQPTTCNPSPINQVGLFGTGLSITSNPVDVTTPGTASSFAWFGAPGKSRYFVPLDLITGTIGSTVWMPFVPNSMLMDQTGTNLYFGSTRELMVYNTATDTLAKEDPSVPGVVLAVSPNNKLLLINDPVRQVFYLYNTGGSVLATFGGTSCSPGVTCGGLGSSAAWTPDSKTLYVTDSAALGGNHTDTLYVYNLNTGWTTYDLSASGGAQRLAVTVPGVGAYLSGNPTTAHTWCPKGTSSNYAAISFYPEGDSVSTPTDVLAATSDGNHILGATLAGSGIELTDIGVNIPTTPCPETSNGTLSPLTIGHDTPVFDQLTVGDGQHPVLATGVNQVVTTPAPVGQGKTVSNYSLSFITYDGNTPGAALPYYKQTTSLSGTLTPGTIGYVPLVGASAITAPLAGAFSPDASVFFVSTAGDNKIHYIDTLKLTDTQQVSPNLPACTPGTDLGCTLAAPSTNPVPTTVIVTKPRSTT